MSAVDKILQRVNLRYEDLNRTERETLESMNESLAKNQVTLDTWKEALTNMRDSVEIELIDEPEFIYIFIFRFVNRKQILLKARLKNYMLMLAFLDRPKKAQQAIDRAISGMVNSTK